MTPRRRDVMVSGLVLAVAGCSGSDEAGGGDREVTVGHLTVTVPAGWTEQDARGTWDRGFAGDGLELQISGTLSEDPTASAAYSRLDLPATMELPGYRSGGVHQPDVEVEGADTSMRADFTYMVEGAQREGAWVIAGQWPHPSTAAIALTGESLESDVVQSIIDSLRFTRTQGGKP